MQVKILHAADFHLESPFSNLCYEKAEERREELKRAFSRVIDLCIKEQVQILLLAGDLFEHHKATRELMDFLNQGFNRLVNSKIFIAPGNHDPGVPMSSYWKYAWNPNVHIFREQFEVVELPELGCRVYGFGFAHFAVKERHLAKLSMLDRSLINLVLFHGEAIINSLASGSSNYFPFTKEELFAAGADYYALGHYHRPEVLWEHDGSPKACYSGSPEPLGFDEQGEHGVFCGYISQEKNNLRFIQLNTRSYRTVRLKCSGEESLEELALLARTTISQPERQRDFHHLVFTGEVSPAFQFDQAKLEHLLWPDFYYCKVENATVPRYELSNFDRRTAKGMFISRISAMIEQEQDEVTKEVLRDSLYLGLDAMNLGKVVER